MSTMGDRLKPVDASPRNRRAFRMLRAKWHRFTHFEFWPWWVFYAPVIGYVMARLVPKFRSLTVFTAANPFLPAGGLLGESKSTVLRELDHKDGRVANWTLIDQPATGAERIIALDRWM